MQSEGNTSIDSDNRERIWFFPHKFWQATKGMAKDEVSRLMSEVEQDAAAKNFEALRKYSFVYVGDPYKDSAA